MATGKLTALAVDRAHREGHPVMLCDGWAIEMRLQGLHEREGPWYVMEHQLTDGSGNVVSSMGRSDWADWSRSGEVLFARSGRLYRISLDSKRAPGEPEELIDLRDLKFEPIEAPQDAKVWGGRGPRGRILKGRGN